MITLRQPTSDTLMSKKQLKFPAIFPSQFLLDNFSKIIFTIKFVSDEITKKLEKNPENSIPQKRLVILILYALKIFAEFFDQIF